MSTQLLADLLAEVTDPADMCRGCMHLYETPEKRDPKTGWAWRKCPTPGCKYHGAVISYPCDWENRMRESLRPYGEIVQRTLATSKSADAHGLPTNYTAAVEEVHEWRQAAHEGAMTPGALRKALASVTGLHEQLGREHEMLVTTQQKLALASGLISQVLQGDDILTDRKWLRDALTVAGQ